VGRGVRPRWLVILRAFGRLQEITTTLFANGFGWFVRAMRLDACVSARCRVVCALTHHQCEHHLAMTDSAPERLRAMLEHLGPTFVKAGQLASLRPDLVPLPYAEALRALQDRAAPLPFAAVERAVAAEAGAPLAEVFDDFDPEPLASASLSQVHWARLPDGAAVAVKVQRPGVGELVARDLELIELMAERLERYSEQARRFEPRRAAAEFVSYTRRELDFTREAQTMEQVRANMSGEQGVVVPRVHRGLTTPRLLVMDFVSGVRVDDRAGIAELGIDTRRAAERAARALVRQVFVDGLFHADPHPGNVLLLEGDAVAFLDFGMFGRIDPWLRHRMAVAFGALMGDHPEEAADQLIRAASVLPDSELDEYRFALAQLVSVWREGEGAMTVAQLLLRELGLGIVYGVSYPREMMLVARALVAAEGSANAADPSLDIAQLAASAAGSLPRQVTRSAMSLGRGLFTSRTDTLELVEELPVLIPRLIDALERPQGRAPEPPSPSPAALPTVALLATAALAGWAARGAAESRRARGNHAR